MSSLAKHELPHTELVAVESASQPPSTPKELAIAVVGIFKSTRIKLEDRDAEYTRMRREAISGILRGTNILSPEVVESPVFEVAYRKAEQEQSELISDPDRLGELAEKYEDSPFTETLDIIHKELGRGDFGRHVIPMRRTGLLLLEHFDES